MKTELTPGTIGRIEAIIDLRESVLSSFESAAEKLPEDHWKAPMYNSLIDAYTESMKAIDEILGVLGWDWETGADGIVRLVERSED